MKTTLTHFRQNIYKIIDKLIKTGTPVEIERNGWKIKVLLEKKKSKLANLKSHNILNCGPEDVIYNNWSKEWKKDLF